MEHNKYSAQLNMDLYYYEHMHRRRPEKIFMSHHLMSMIVTEDNVPICYSSNNAVTYCGVPVQVYMSGKLEYHFATHGFVFEDEE